MSNQVKNRENPLASFMRQPKIYIKLPSNGKFWSTGSIELSETEEYPVYSMTAKDELLLKVPDALLSGQAVVDVIQNCIPNIKNAWSTPVLDLDVILIAIRIATYGEKMKIPLNIKDYDEEYELDLRYVLNSLQDQIYWDESLQVSPELVVYVKPFDYKQMSASASATFETQKILETTSSSKLTDEEKTQIFKQAIDRLTDVTVNLINKSVYKIDSSQGSTDNIKHIQEFMENVDKEIFEKIKGHIEELRKNNTIKPLIIDPTQEMIEKGVPDQPIEIPLSFDPSNFFG